MKYKTEQISCINKAVIITVGYTFSVFLNGPMGHAYLKTLMGQVYMFFFLPQIFGLALIFNYLPDPMPLYLNYSLVVVFVFFITLLELKILLGLKILITKLLYINSPSSINLKSTLSTHYKCSKYSKSKNKSICLAKKIKTLDKRLWPYTRSLCIALLTLQITPIALIQCLPVESQILEIVISIPLVIFTYLYTFYGKMPKDRFIYILSIIVWSIIVFQISNNYYIWINGFNSPWS